jgi:hypothetical protein
MNDANTNESHSLHQPKEQLKTASGSMIPKRFGIFKEITHSLDPADRVSMRTFSSALSKSIQDPGETL